MKKTARHHHYLSQCYLKGFAIKSGSKKAKLTVIDAKRKKTFQTNPRNVGGIRDFNRIEIDGHEPDAIENDLSNFETIAASSLRRIEHNKKFEGEDKENILNLVALLAVRSPQQREHWRKFQAGIVDDMMGMMLQDKERWDSQQKQMRDAGRETIDDITYEEAKEFYDSKKYKITLSTEHQIHKEMIGIEAVLECLFERNWILVQATNSTGYFITTDRPVVLLWKEPDKIPPLYRSSPGHGTPDTQIYFPISKNLFLLGEFDRVDGSFEADKQFVAVLNSMMIAHAYEQIYTPRFSFNFVNTDETIQNGSKLLSSITVK